MERSESVADKVVGSGPPALLGVKKHSLPFHCPGLFPNCQSWTGKPSGSFSGRCPHQRWSVIREWNGYGQQFQKGRGCFPVDFFSVQPLLPHPPSSARLPSPETEPYGCHQPAPQMMPERSQSFVREMAGHGGAVCVLANRKQTTTRVVFSCFSL